MAKGKEPGTHHVVPNDRGGWDVRRGGADRASGHFDTKREAVDRGREISRNAGTEFKIHKGFTSAAVAGAMVASHFSATVSSAGGTSRFFGVTRITRPSRPF